MKNFRIAIIGGGLSGSMTALYFSRAGYQVDVFEKRGDPVRRAGTGGRNINLAITRQSLKHLQQVGLESEITHSSVALDGRVFHSFDGACSYQPYVEPGDPKRSLLTPERGVRSVARPALNSILIDRARNQPNVHFHFGQELVSLEPTEGVLTFANAGGNINHISADLIVGADGAFSRVRGELVRQAAIEETIIPLDYGYKELRIDAQPEGGSALKKNALHLWPREGYLLIALPNPDGTFRCSLFLPHSGKNSLASLVEPDAIQRFLKHNFADVFEWMNAPADDFVTSPTGKLLTLRCSPWHCGKTVLIGDACHAMLPFTGQGVNSAFEDCHTLLQCVEESTGHLPEALSKLEQQRKQPTDMISNMGMVATPILLNFVTENVVTSDG